MIRSVIYFSLIALVMCTRAYCQEATKKLVYKDGFIVVDSGRKYVYLDTIPSSSMSSIPTLLIVTHDRILGIDGCGQIYMSSNIKVPILKPAFKSKSCMGLKEPKRNFVITQNDKAYFISIDDGYFKKRSLRLIEFNLTNQRCQIIDIGDNLDNLYYATNSNNLHYSKNGIDKFYNGLK